MWRADYWWNLPISNPKPDFHNIIANSKFGKNPLTFTQVIVQKQKYWQMYDRQTQMDKHMQDQHETIIPRHMIVAGYEKQR